MLTTRSKPLGYRIRGFTLTEILVSIAMIAILAATIYPTVMGRVRSASTTSLSQTFAGLSAGIAEYKRATGHYPGSLLLLTTPPIFSDLDICAAQTGATAVALWRGPYASRPIPSSGIPMGDGTIPTGLRRVIISGTYAYLMIDAAAVPQSTADDLESQLDGGTADGTAGTIRYTTSQINSTSTSAQINATAAPYTNLSYAIPINSC
jgi:prepilin-type N-terminal cleavage/methylation domain-containing protein